MSLYESGDYNSIFNDARILITGGTGSIGLELTKALLRHKPRSICLFSNDENSLFEARMIFSKYPEVIYKLGDVRDIKSVERVIKDYDFVFHAAALKHVTFCEENPYEAISTNILGTQNMIDCAIKYGIEKFVFVSTDKAVNPISVMGATKLLGEKLVISASKLTNKPIFSIVRFGNVLASRGSVVLIFERQVKEGGPITVTDPEMTRFVMLPSEAAQLVLRAAEIAKPGEIFVLKMRAVKIGVLAEACKEFFCKLYGKDERTIKIVEIGSNVGEKIHEELMTASEALNAIETEHFYIINPHPERAMSSKPYSASREGYSSDKAPSLSKEEIIALLSKLYDTS
jgi:FlaA1/EpsC-like NDP-sugar epimerase